VSVEAEARMGHGRKPRSPDTCQIKPTDRHQALAADFFDNIDPELTRAPYGPWELGQYGAQTAVKTLQAKIYDP